MFDTSFSKEPEENNPVEQNNNTIIQLEIATINIKLIKFCNIFERKISHQKIFAFRLIESQAQTKPIMEQLQIQIIRFKTETFVKRIQSIITHVQKFQKQDGFQIINLLSKIEKQNKKASLARSVRQSNLKSRQQSINSKGNLQQLRTNNTKLKAKIKQKKAPFDSFSKKLQELLGSHEHYLDSL